MTEYIISFIEAMIRMSVPLTFAALGEVVCERSGIINIGIEGSLLSGAFFGYLTTYHSGSLILGFLAGIAAGIVINLIHAVLSIYLCQDQTVCGVALNILSLGFITFLFTLSESSAGTESINTLGKISIPGLSSIPIFGRILFQNDLIVYLMFVLIILLMFFFNKTFWGLSLDAVGENPQAADTAGISVFSWRYIAEIFCGAMCGIGGAYLTLVQVGRYTNNVTSGRGYIALAIVVFGRRSPVGVFGAALFFGAVNALQFRLQSMGVPLPTQFLTGLPYLMTVFALLITAGKGTDPESLSKPYLRNMR